MKTRGDLDFGIQASINNRISRYGTAVTVGVFMGAAISAGTILGALTWYAVSKNILTDVVKDLSGQIHPLGPPLIRKQILKLLNQM